MTEALGTAYGPNNNQKAQYSSMNNTTRTLAHQTCQENGWSFEEVFQQQYRISKIPAKLPKISTGWSVCRLNDWMLEHCKSLQVTRLKQGNGKLVGLLLGIGITLDGNCLGKTKIISYDLEEWIESLAGRYIVLAIFGKETRLYQDPSGNLSSVYNSKEKTIASSVSLVLNNAIQPHDDVTSQGVINKTEKFLFGETSDVRATRARPNHYLSLTDFSETRHWPREDTQFDTLDVERMETYSAFAKKIRRNVLALVKAYSCALPITAGRDSRIILASAAPVLDQIKAFYCYELNRSTRVDVKGSTALAQFLGIPFQVISRKSQRLMAQLPEGFQDEEHQKMLLRTGWCYHMRADWGPYVALSPRVDVVLRGTGLEMTRANKWTAEHATKPCDAVIGLRTLAGLRPGKSRTDIEEKRYQKLLRLYEEWMDGLPKHARMRAYDLAHMELMLPAGPVLEYSAFVGDMMVNPMNDRRLYQLAAGIAPRARRRGALVYSIINQNCPGLLKFPYFAEIAAKEEEKQPVQD